jgi:hypothetical protein
VSHVDRRPQILSLCPDGALGSVKCGPQAVGVETDQFRRCKAVLGNQNGSGTHPASYPMGNRGSFPEGKAAGA